ncbi:hypothetical protein Cni_G25373 [Canna indica]|uniref:Uncharacterized protein n=1 Tax=Canna indica TaxID=4628 RepID=A0AAQ3L1S5_9LILI|nr:hypothetical protein Cni_G25373 [Canna indica]
MVSLLGRHSCVAVTRNPETGKEREGTAKMKGSVFVMGNARLRREGAQDEEEFAFTARTVTSAKCHLDGWGCGDCVH